MFSLPPQPGTLRTQDAFLSINIIDAAVQEKGASYLKMQVLCLLEPQGSEQHALKNQIPREGCYCDHSRHFASSHGSSVRICSENLLEAIVHFKD